MRYPPFLSRLAVILLAALFAVPPALARANVVTPDEEYDNDDPSARVARVSFVDGDASLRQPGSDEWEEVGRNTPVFAGDEYYTGRHSRLEVQLGGGRYVRLSERTDVVFAELSPDFVRMEVPAGSVAISVRDLDRGEWFEVSAPSAAVSIRDEGIYRIDVRDGGDTRVSVLRGRADVSGTNDSVALQTGESVDIGYETSDYYAVGSLAYRDDFDSWCHERDDYYEGYLGASAPVSSLLNRNDIYGLAELAAFGSWLNVGGYGYCWQPSVGSGWSPYSSGYWQWYPSYGYTWVSNEPWGWAPYHSGRWLYDARYGWVWVPWSSFSGGNYYWQPHQVYFYGYPGYNGYAWVPLAPREPYVSYRALSRRHHDYAGFQPVNLRNGRGIVVAPRTDDGRLQPVRVDPGIKTRGPVATLPVQPPRVAVVKPRFDPRPVADNLRLKPVVIKERPSVDVKPRTGVDGGGAIERRPVRVAVDKPPRLGNEKPRVEGGNDRVPTMVDVDQKPRRQPAQVGSGSDETKPRRQTDAADEPKPRRDTDADQQAPRRNHTETVAPSDNGSSGESKPQDRPKPRRVQPVGPDSNDEASGTRRNRNNDSGDDGRQRDRVKHEGDNQDRGQTVVVPRREQPSGDSGSKSRDVERNNPPPRVEHNNPPVHVERNNPPPVERNNPPPRVERTSPPPPARVDPPKDGRKP